MTDKELKRLSRVELIDIIYELQKQKDAADVRVAQLQEKLNQRELRIAQAGSIAEAAIGLNGVFEAAQAAADQYLHSIQTATSSINRMSRSRSTITKCFLKNITQLPLTAMASGYRSTLTQCLCIIQQ